MQTPEALAPQVVAVVVACDPGEWFEEELAALTAQEYPGLSVLVLDVGLDDLTGRVAAVAPDAYVRRLAHNLGFGASANTVLEMVEGASHFLFCHDDVAPDPEALSVMVEESFRSNAGVVAPKYVRWDDPRGLLNVGMTVDKGGAVVGRIELGEIDHGQHDAVRDVFLAAGGCTLVRADLFAEIGGYDPQIFAMGEDLDLCWRAQVAGARVVVAPGARVRHLQLLASGRRGLPDDVRNAVPRLFDTSSAQGPDSERKSHHAADEADDAPGRRRRASRARRARTRTEQVTLQSLQRRHELRAVLKNYGYFHRFRVLPQLALSSVAEILVAWATGHRARAAAVVHAWRWNVTERATLRAARVKVQATRRLDDASVRRLQLRGSARLLAYLRRAVTHGMSAARLGHIDETEETEQTKETKETERRAAAAADAEWRIKARATRTARAVIWTAVAVVLIFGTRQLIGSGFPYVGQLLPFASWSSFLHHFISGWQPSGVGTTSAATPGTAMLGLGGLVLLGGVGLLQKIVVLGCIPLGALGMSRLVSGFGSVWARVAASVTYLVVPLPYDALATGRWDALLAYAGCPWIVVCLARASAGASRPTSGPGAEAIPEGSTVGSEPFALLARHGADTTRRPLPRWRTTLAGRTLGLGVLEALFTSLAPSVAVLTLLVTAGLALGTLVAGGRGSRRAAGRVVAMGAGATAVTTVLLAPWSASVLAGPARWQELAGLASTPSSGPTWGGLLHLGVGPIGDTPLAWGFVLAAALPLLIGSGPRLVWAGRAWVLAALAWACAWAGGRGWLGVLSVPGEVLLVPAGVGIAMAVGLGVAAFEEDLPGYRFGWRQAAAGLAALFAFVATLPVLVASVSGRWDLPANGYGEATSWMSYRSPGNFRVLWLGDPAVLPAGAWQLSKGFAYALSENGLGDVTSLWPGSSPGPASTVGAAVRLAESAKTVRLGHLLAPYAVRYVVVVSSLGPSTVGSQSTLSRSLPSDLPTGLARQIDLRQLISQSGFEVFVDDAALPERALRPAPPAGANAVRGVTRTTPSATVFGVSTSGSSPALSGWHAVLRGVPGSTHVTGRVGAGTIFDAVAPESAWQLVGPGVGNRRAQLAFGYAPSFRLVRPAVVTVRFAGSWRHGLAVGAEVALWIVVLGAFGGRRRWFERWHGLLRRRYGSDRHPSRSPSAVVPSSTEHDRGPEVVHGVGTVEGAE
jgi:GT2 family glycosyltransferase